MPSRFQGEATCRDGGMGGSQFPTALFVFLLVAAGFNSFALEPSDILVYSKGPLSIRPHVGISTEYNNNVYFRESNVQSDLITDIAPGLKILLGSDIDTENHLSLDYRLDQLFYLDESNLNASQHKIDLDGRYHTERTSIEGSDNFSLLSGPLGGVFGVNGQKIDRAVWADLYRFDYQLGERSGIYVQGSHAATDYRTSLPLFDSRTIQGTFGFEWDLSSETHIFGEGYYGKTTLDNNVPGPDVPGKTFYGGFVGARGKFTEKLSGTVKAGYQLSRFEGGTVGLTGPSTSDAPVVESTLTYAYTERTSFRLRYSRQQRVSVEFTRSGYTADEISTSASAILGSSGRLLITASVRAAFYDYDPSTFYATRQDTLWGAGASISWYFQTWFSVRFQYDFNQFGSTLPSLVEYSQNRITIGADVGY